MPSGPPQSMQPAKRPRTAEVSNPAPAPALAPTQPPPRKLEDYTIHRVIGTGGSATVLRATPLDAPHAPVALKALAKRGLSRRAQRYLAREIAVHRSVAAHPHIVSLKDAFENRHGIYLVMDLLRGGDLYALLKKEKRPLAPMVALVILKQLVDALSFLHARGISHRDLKLENIMFSRPLRKGTSMEPVASRFDVSSVDVQLVDFGLACARDPSSKGDARLSRESCGTKNYCAPEVLRARHAPYSPEVADMWSCGVVLYAMLTRRLPFNDAGQGEGFAGMGAGVEVKFDTPELRKVPDGVLGLLRQLLSVDATRRPSAAETLVIVNQLLAEDEVRRQPRAAAAFVRDGRLMSGGGVVGLGDGRQGKNLAAEEIEVLVEGANVAVGASLDVRPKSGENSGTCSGETSGDHDGGGSTDPDLATPSEGRGRRRNVSEGRSPDGMDSLVSEASGGDVVKAQQQQPMPFNLGFLRGVFDLFSFGNSNGDERSGGSADGGNVASSTSNGGESSVDGDDENGGDDENTGDEEKGGDDEEMTAASGEAASMPPSDLPTKMLEVTPGTALTSM